MTNEFLSGRLVFLPYTITSNETIMIKTYMYTLMNTFFKNENSNENYSNKLTFFNIMLLQYLFL